MQKTVQMSGQNIEYTLKISPRAKVMRLAVYPNGSLIVTVPRFFNLDYVAKFLDSKSSWISSKLKYFAAHKPRTKLVYSKSDYKKLKIVAKNLVEQRLLYFNQTYNLKWGRVAVRDQSTRWGSCSKKGNLNFNFRIALITPEQADYIVVHELCHLAEFNHSKNFWELVKKTIPNYVLLRRQVKQYSLD